MNAPTHTPEAAIRAWVLAKQAWIAHHQAAFRARPQPAARQYVSGETHYVQGRAYPLRVTERPGRAQVTLTAGELHLALSAGHDAAARARAVQQWYRAWLLQQVLALLAKWEPVVGARAAAWGIKAMRTRWGTCNVRARRL